MLEGGSMVGNCVGDDPSTPSYIRTLGVRVQKSMLHTRSGSIPLHQQAGLLPIVEIVDCTIQRNGSGLDKAAN